MKILIVDDDPKRYQLLFQKLTSNGVDEKDIAIVIDCMAAREKLEDVKFELLIIDIIIPLRTQDEADSKHSRDLLEELTDEDGLIKPNKILGLTADISAADGISDFFEDHTWRLIHYDPTSDSWSNQIINCVNYLQKSSNVRKKNDYLCDVAILCALRDPELNAILRLPWGWSELKPLAENLFGYEGRFTSNSKEFSVFASYCTRMGIVSSALSAARVIDVCRPRHIIMSGICGGIQGKVPIGAAILADPTWDWQSGKIDSSKEENRFAVAPHQLAVDYSVRTAFDSLSNDQKFCRAVQDGWQEKPPSEFRLSAGPLASGSAVLADSDVVTQIKNSHRELIGIDMEVYGLYAAATMACSPRPTPFAVKSVCDFANSDKNDNYQAYAAYTSAQTVKELLEKYYFGWV